MQRHSLFDELDEALAAQLPHEPVELAGQWHQSTRRSNRGGSPISADSGPLADIVDTCWQGSLASAEPIVGLAFLAMPAAVHWAKTASAGATLDVVMSLSAYADNSPRQATFTARVADAGLPGVVVGVGPDLQEACTVHGRRATTARVELLASTTEATFAAILLPRRFVTFGRHRLWRVRDDIASSLPERVRHVFTRGRNGTMA